MLGGEALEDLVGVDASVACVLGHRGIGRCRVLGILVGLEPVPQASSITSRTGRPARAVSTLIAR